LLVRAGLREVLAALWESGLRGEPATAHTRMSAPVAAVTALMGAPKSRVLPAMLQVQAQCRAGVWPQLLPEASCLTHHIFGNPS
jgi:hypothetical protein